MSSSTVGQKEAGVVMVASAEQHVFSRKYVRTDEHLQGCNIASE